MTVCSPIGRGCLNKGDVAINCLSINMYAGLSEEIVRRPEWSVAIFEQPYLEAADVGTLF